NLAPSELKKLRNKQRKARRKAEQESAQAREAQVKRDQHHKSRQQGDVEADAPQLDELVPDKLARADDPLEQAIKFIQPLQCLAKDRIETHLMAFEVYYRKRKVLLMLQSLKRMYKVDPKNPKLHSCLIRFHQIIQEYKNDWDPSVDEVVTRETKLFFEGKDAKQLNKEFLETKSNSLRAVLEGAKMMYYLDNKSQSQALSLVTSHDNKYQDVNIEICTEILNSLRKGDFGSCDAQLEEYVKKCNKRFPYTAAFKPPSELTSPSESNHVTQDQDNYNSN
ncbi:hypothetical protein NQ317_011202, partial [Molorchus minor]